MYVDDNLIADIRPIMKQTMSANIEAIFILMGYPKTPQKEKCNKKSGMLDELQHWYRARKSFNIKQVATLFEKHSVAMCLSGNSIILKAIPKRFQKLEDYIKANKISTDHEVKACFA
eukprot:5779005-Ditylum_brightwellii.AAC.2